MSNDVETVRRRTGFDPFEHSLPPKLAIDGYRSSMPLMATAGNDVPLIFLKEIDRTNVERLKQDGVRFVWHSPYFSFGGLRRPSDSYPNLEAALISELDDPVTLDSRMTVDLYRTLQGALDVRADDEITFSAPRVHYEIQRDDVAMAFAPGRAEIREAAGPFVSDLKTDQLDRWLSREPDDRFAILDELMDESGLDGLLVASPLAIQDLTGIPIRAIGEEVWAFYLRGSNIVHVLSRRELPWQDLPLATKAGSDTIEELSKGPRIGVEEVAFSFEAWSGFGLKRFEDFPATGLMRRWRERRSWEDVAAYVIGSRLTLEAIHAALSFVDTAFKSGRPVTEIAAYNRYRSKVGSMIRANGLPLHVRTYFTHTHAGNRSHFPASATEHVIPATSSLKIDGGLEIYDSRGMFLGVSDITRSTMGTEEVRSFYELLDAALIKGAIAACRAGAKGSDVFSAGLSFLEPHRSTLIRGAFMPASNGPLTRLFRRNIGHLIGKQEPATVEFAVDSELPLEAGMVGAAEFQWPYADYTIGIEDLFLVTETDPVNLTRPMQSSEGEES